MTGKADAVTAVSQQVKDRTDVVIEGVMAHLRDDNAKEILGPALSALVRRGSLKSIVTCAVYADVLRMVRDMMMADGESSDEEVQESFGLLSVLAAEWAKERKEYAAFKALPAQAARTFLSQYAADTGFFGYANDATKWAGIDLCRNVQQRCGDAQPLDALGSALVGWAEAFAKPDGPTASQRDVLQSLRTRVANGQSSGAAAGSGDDRITTVLAAEYEDFLRWRLKGQGCEQWLAERQGRVAEWQRVAQAGDPRAQLFVGLCHDYGVGISSADKKAAVRLYRAAVNQGNAPAMSCLGLCYDYGEGVPEDKKEAVRWYRAAAEKGDAPAMIIMGDCCAEGEGIEKDPEEAVRWYRAAAEGRSAEGLAKLGVCYEIGAGVPEDKEEAVRCFLAAADLGDAGALNNLGCCYLKGVGTPKNQAEAVRCFRAAAELGNAQALFNLGRSYDMGEGVAQDRAEALTWYRRAAELGQVDAQRRLASWLIHGVAVPANVKEGVAWLRKAAEQGDAESQNSLGRFYDTGVGVALDRDEARKWLHKAAAQGSEAARSYLVDDTQREAAMKAVIEKCIDMCTSGDSVESTAGYNNLLNIGSQAVPQMLEFLRDEKGMAAELVMKALLEIDSQQFFEFMPADWHASKPDGWSSAQ